MKYLKMLGLAVVAATALMSIMANTASATTLEITSETQNRSVTLTWSPYEPVDLARTDGSLANECTSGHWHESTSSYTSARLSGPAQYALNGCTRPITVHKGGTMQIEHIAGSTDGTLFSSEAEITVSTVFGTVNCKTGSGTDLGLLTGVSSGSATMHVNAVLNCGFLLPSATLVGDYILTSPHALGVSA